jgi:hypothetical protein
MRHYRIPIVNRGPDELHVGLEPEGDSLQAKALRSGTAWRTNSTSRSSNLSLRDSFFRSTACPPRRSGRTVAAYDSR